MKFSFPFLVAVVPLVFHLAVTTHAAPLSEVGTVSGELRAREMLLDGFEDGLFARARKGGAPKGGAPKPPLKPAQLSQRIQNVQKGQTARKEAKDKKKALNNRTTRNLKKPKTTHGPDMTPQDKLAQKNIGKAITKAANDKKLNKVQKWASKKKTPAQAAASKAAKTQRRKDRKAAGTPAPPPRAPGPKALAKQQKKAITSQERNQVKNAFKAADRKKKAIADLPSRTDKLQVGTHQFSGKDVRQAAFNSYLHKGHPVGHENNKNPKRFGNRRYPATHPDASIRGQRPIPGARAGTEYPIKSNSHNGYIGSGSVGAGRIITYKNPENRHQTKYAVVGHDPSRGGDPSDHYLAQRV